MDIYVEIPNEYLWDAVQRHEHEVRGKVWLDDRAKYVRFNPDRPYLGVSRSTMHQERDTFAKSQEAEIITVDEYFVRYGIKPVKLGEFTVTGITDAGFQVGDFYIRWGKLDEIMALRPKP